MQGAGKRVRPVMMTALTAILGLLPAAVSTKIGGQTAQPLAVVVVGGMTATLFLTRYLMPVLYSFYGHREPPAGSGRWPIDSVRGSRSPRSQLMAVNGHTERTWTMPSIQTILHPTDFSENSQCAFETACALARDYHATLLVLHVAMPSESATDRCAAARSDAVC